MVERFARSRLATVSGSKSGAKGSSAMWLICGGSSAPPALNCIPPNIR